MSIVTKVALVGALILTFGGFCIQVKAGETENLFNAIIDGEVGEVQKLIEKGTDVNAEHFNKDTPLHLAVRFSLMGVIKILIANGANINKQNAVGVTPLAEALVNKAFDIATFLVKQGAAVNPVLLAEAKKGFKADIEVLKFLVEQGGILVNQTEESPLHVMGEWIRIELAHALLPFRHRKEPEALAMREIFGAAFLEHGTLVESVRLLISVDPVFASVSNKDKETLFSIAAKFNDFLLMGPKKFIERALVCKGTAWGFNDQELEMSKRIFTDKSPLINLLIKYKQNWQTADEVYFQKNIKSIVPASKKKNEFSWKKKPYEDIKIFFSEED
ncbi:TPA: hypothetical protein DDZ86_03970 [Candidatus Dependentiae bacterium]|nr:MAG: hypothetical protein UW09_C0003G0147 [candidate division TM6 bacterium GW2011_GWF2_43_87]HBL98773.1 hypothetical protein [Candidatus Dependentiae bacterium]